MTMTGYFALNSVFAMHIVLLLRAEVYKLRMLNKLT